MSFFVGLFVDISGDYALTFYIAGGALAVLSVAIFVLNLTKQLTEQKQSVSYTASQTIRRDVVQSEL